MTIRFRMHLIAQFAIALAVFVCSGSAYAQTSSRFPATVKPGNGGVEVVTYSGTDRLLQRGDIISWVATPDSENQVAVKTSTSLEAEVLAKQAKDGTIALWVTRGNADPDWVFLKVAAPPAPGQLPLTVRQGNEGVEVVTYSAQDGKLRKGDLISWVATPDSDNQVAVNSPAGFEAEAAAKKASDGTIALWVTRGNAEPDWVIVNLSKANNGSKSGTGGPSRPGSPPSTKTPGSAGTTNVTPGSADDASMLHTLYIYDPKSENDSFRWGCEFDVYRVNSYLSQSIPGRMYSDYTFATPTQDADGLLSFIREYKNKISANDTLMVYYSGHGTNDSRDGQSLDLRPGVKVARSDVKQAMQDTGARLCVLITDCCAAGSKEPLYSNSRTVTRPKSTYWNTNICRALFFRHRGFVDVTSAGPGELAWSVGPTDENKAFIGKEPTDGGVFEDGGLFTTSLLEILSMDDGELTQGKMMDSQGRVTWDSVKAELAKRTEDRFQRTIYAGFRRQRDKDKHKHQTVTFLSTGQPTGNALPPVGRSVLGIQVLDGPNGVVAGNVDADRTPAWVAIKPGDRLVSIRRLTDSYYAHFWVDKKITSFVAPAQSLSPDDLPFGYRPIEITSLNDFQQLIVPTANSGSPKLSSGLWIFSVERGGELTDIPIRIAEESSRSYETFTTIQREE